MYLFPSVACLVVAILLHLALPLALLLLLALAGGSVALAVAGTFLAPIPLVLAAPLTLTLTLALLPALLAGLDVLLEGDHRPLADVQHAVLALPGRQDRLETQRALVGHLLAVGRFLEDRRVLLLGLLDDLLWDVGDEQQQAVTHPVLDEPESRAGKQRAFRSNKQTKGHFRIH